MAPGSIVTIRLTSSGLSNTFKDVDLFIADIFIGSATSVTNLVPVAYGSTHTTGAVLRGI
jgi:hypothetical protein